MRVRSVKNQYIGINAHLHSRLQAEGGWGGFHTRHIVHIADALAAQLVPNGYVVEIEESLQIRRNFDYPQYRADVLISDAYPARTFTTSPNVQDVSMPDVMPAIDFIAEDDRSDVPFRAISIAPREQEPIVWIELLSPSNKGKSGDALVYRTKRMDLLHAGMVFVELDYLNETPPTSSKLPTYYARQATTIMSDAHPYWIVVIDPRPTLETGQARVVGFDVEALIPTVAIPLSGTERIEFDFGIPYNVSFAVGMLGYEVDYAELPLNFDRYRPADQLRILRRMLTVMRATADGADLETVPLPVPDDDMTLSAALATYEQQRERLKTKG